MFCPTPGSPCPRCSATLTAFSPAGLGDAACDSCQVYWLEKEEASFMGDEAQWDGPVSGRFNGEVVIHRGDFTSYADAELCDVP